jgi:anthranilate phosphoribosyltransferase
MSETLASLTKALGEKRELSPAEVALAASALASEKVSDDAKAPFLVALASKGETSGEIAAFAAAFRSMALDPGLGAWSGRAIDIVGTGGDHAGGFNVSTLVTLVVASAGVPVMKHGNRGITSKCGSADLFSAFGVSLEASPEKLGKAMETLGYVFLFAPSWHPSFRSIGPVRKALAAQGQRTVFNILGPLLNPGRPAHILLGAASAALVAKLADALETLGTQAGVAAHGVLGPDRGIDEMTSATDNRVRGVGRLRSLDGVWTPESLGLNRSPFTDILGGGVEANVALANALADGSGPRGLADTIALNAAVALWIVGARPEVSEAIAETRELLQGGAVKRRIAATREFYAA